MANVEVLMQSGDLDAVRGRLGWDEGDDTAPYDARINAMDAKAIIALWTGWHLGAEEWGRQIVNLYEQLQKDAQ